MTKQPRHVLFALTAWLLLLASIAWAGPDALLDITALPVHIVQVGDVELGCRTLGQGRPLLLITGYGCTMESWDPTLVAALSSNHRVILFDNRGMGASTASEAPFSISRFADDAAGLLQALGIPKADIMGWSMGAMTALEIGLAHPDAAGRIVAYGAAFDGAQATAAVERMGSMTKEEFRAGMFPAAWSLAHPDVFDRIPKPTVPPRPEAVRQQRQALAAWPGFGERLSGLDKEVLLIVGEADWVTPPEESLRLAGAIKGSWLVRLPEAGHWLMYQEPRTLASIIEAFLDREETCPARSTRAASRPADPTEP